MKKAEMEKLFEENPLLKNHVDQLLEYSLAIQRINTIEGITKQEVTFRTNRFKTAFWVLFKNVMIRELNHLNISNESTLYHLINHKGTFAVPYPRTFV